MEDKMRIVQELVPGKQITLAHIIANPDTILYQKLGLAADLAMKASGAELGFVDRFSGTLIITGSISAVEASLRAILDYTKEKLSFTVCEITRT